VLTPASGDVVVTVARLDGTIVQGPVTATPDGADGYAFTFAGSDVLDELMLTWAAQVGGDAIILDQDVIQVVGGFYLGLGEIRAIDPVFQGVSGLARYPTQDLIERRIETEDEFERICGQAFVPRFARETLAGTGRGYLKLGWPRLRRVRAITVGGVAWEPDRVAWFGSDLLGVLRSDAGWPFGVGNIVVEYEHGMDRPPTDIVRVARLRMKSHLLTTKSPLPDRAERIATTEVGTVTLAIASKFATGIPEVDAALERFPSPRPGFG
jgi:hypothetical protein